MITRFRNKICMGCPTFWPIDDLKEMYVNNKLTIVADLKISGEEEVFMRDGEDKQLTYNTKDNEKELFTNLKEISSLDFLADFTIICEDQKFPCHKVILAARSDVFRAMLSQETEEIINNEVKIVDSCPEIVKNIIDFIYKGSIPEEIDDVCGDLIYLATKYNLTGLALACEVALVKTICDANALSTLVLIDRHCPRSSIRDDVIKYISMNTVNIIDTEHWETFVKQEPKLVTEVMKILARKTEEKSLKFEGIDVTPRPDMSAK